MIRVKNKKMLSKLAKRLFKANKLRNSIAIIAIILTTVLFTSVFTIGMSVITSFEESSMRQVGGSSHGSFKYLSQEAYDKLKQHPSIKEMNYSVPIGITKNKELAKHPGEIRYVSNEREAELSFSKPSTGRLPQTVMEIAMDDRVLKALGLSERLGEQVILEYEFNGEIITDQFILVGTWKGDPIAPASQIWISEAYGKKILEGYEKKGDTDSVGTMMASVNFNNSRNIEEKIKKVITETGYEINQIAYGVNWAYFGTSQAMDPGALLSIVGGLLVIIFCGYLIISNIFYISITKDSRSYGLLKTIGTTGKQIKQLIRKQGLYLCIIGIPLGLLLGYFIGVVLTPMVISNITSLAAVKVSANPLIFFGAGIFGILTVLISIKKPAKIAGRVSPIEALKITEGQGSQKKKTKKSTGVNLIHLGINNVFRSPKKAVLVIISLSLSLIIFNMTHIIVNSFSMDTYLKQSINSDFTLANVNYYNNYTGFKGQETLSDDLLTAVSNQEGVESLENIRFLENMHPVDAQIVEAVNQMVERFQIEDQRAFLQEMLDSGEVPSHVYGIDPMIFENLELFQGSSEFEQFNTGDFVIAGPVDSEGKLNYYEVGDKVRLHFSNGNNKEYEVIAVGKLPYASSVRHSHEIAPDFILPNREFILQNGATVPMLSVVNTEDSYEEKMETYLEDYEKNTDPELMHQSKKTYEQEFLSIQKMYLSIGSILAFIIGFIGVMNFINTMITSVMSRRRELAMLQSIGMTNRQVYKMLSVEGLTYTFLSFVFTLSIGSLLSYFCVGAIVGTVWFFSLNFSVLPVLCCLPVLLILGILIPVLCYYFSSRESIVQRLQEIE